MVATNSLNINSTGVVSYNSTTGVFSESALTQHDLLIGGASNAITSLSPGAVSGVPVISQGAGSDPAFGTAVVAGGGTGLATLTAYELIAAGTTSTGALQQIGLGLPGQVLTSNGAGALASYQSFTPTAQVPYINVTGATQTMAVNEFYIANAASGTVTFTPPAVCAVGTVFGIAGAVAGAGGAWTIDLTANSQTFNYGNTAGTTSVSSNNRYDAVQFVCTVANTTFVLINSVGNPSVV